MDSNLCFCGSEKNKSQCHYDVNEDSVLANMIKSYNKLSNSINDSIKKQSVKLPCKKGCSQCCNDYFYIDQFEYYVILYRLLRRGEDVKKLYDKANHIGQKIKKVYPDEYNKVTSKIKTSIISDNDFNINIPCIFLNDKNYCNIYSARPYVCRIHSVLLNECKCTFKKNFDKKYPNYTLPTFEKTYDDVDIYDFFPNGKIKTIEYPMWYWFSHFLKYYLDGKDIKFYYFQHKSEAEFKNLIKKLHRIT